MHSAEPRSMLSFCSYMVGICMTAYEEELVVCFSREKFYIFNYLGLVD